MFRRISLPLLLLAVSPLIVSCVDSKLPNEPTLPSEPAGLRVSEPVWTVQTSGSPSYELPPDARSRWDAPWWEMSDAELADSIAAHDGLAFIGFKEADARGGVDDWGRVLVSHVTAAQAKEALRELGLNLHQEFLTIPAVTATVPRALVSLIRSHPLVDYVTPVGPVEYESQDTTWNVRRVQAPEAWTSSTGSGVKLLVIDTGIPNNHPDLNPAVIQACDGSNGLDQSGHGTHVAGIAAAANNTVHMIGVGHGVQLWSSKTDFYENSVVCALEFGRVNDVAVINMSFKTTDKPIITDVIKGAYADGIFMAKSAGNTNGGAVTYPGTLFETVAVTALDINNNNASFAAVDSHVELAAPGVNIESTSLPSGIYCTNGGYTGFCSGTSMAAPHVAAAAAILKAYNPSWTNWDIRDRLTQSALDLGPSGRDDYYGYGLVQIDSALFHQPPVSVYITGPGYITSAGQYQFTANPSGGDGSYTYQWEIRYPEISSGWGYLGTSQVQNLNIAGGDGDIELRVTATSAGDSGTGYLQVINSIGCSPQVIC